MAEFTSIEELAEEIKSKLDVELTDRYVSVSQAPVARKKVIAVYAFNATGKTRLSSLLSNNDEDESNEMKVLCYNAFLEDIFSWDNENYVLKFDPNSWIIRLVKEQGLDAPIIDNFKDIVLSKIEPSFDFDAGEVSFRFASGDDASDRGIKISRGEESVFMWTVFYTVLETAIDTLNDEEENRTTDIFNNLKYIIIDDPVSSMDDTKIITIAIKLIDKIQKLQSTSIKFLLTTHHALFYNVLVNHFTKDNGVTFKPYFLSKEDYDLRLTKQRSDSPFAYHLSIKELIEKAIQNNSIEKYHFNLFRNLLEKTATFLGYSHWSRCIEGENRIEFMRLLNLYSHSKLSDIESKELTSGDKTLFRETFAMFTQNFKWK